MPKKMSLTDAEDAAREDEDFAAFQGMQDDERVRFIAEQARTKGTTYKPKPWELLFLLGERGREHLNREVPS
jgi:hypothetical protein